MSLPMITKDSRRTVVCSVDPCVVLKPLPQTDDEKAKGVPLKHEARRPVRWLDVADEVGEVFPGATRVTYRPLDADEQFQISAGLPTLDRATLDRAYHVAPAYAVTQIETTLADGTQRVASTPDQVRELLPLALKGVYREPLGARIVDESWGYADPLLKSE